MRSFIFWKNCWLEKKHYDFVWPLETRKIIYEHFDFHILMYEAAATTDFLRSFGSAKYLYLTCSHASGIPYIRIA